MFDEVFVNLVRAGEASGQVAEVLRNITQNLKWQDEQAAHVKRLLMYPAIIAVVVLLVVFFLMTYLVPQLISFINTMGEELPAHTRALLVVSDVFVNYWYVLLTAPVAVRSRATARDQNKPGRFSTPWMTSSYAYGWWGPY